MELGKNATDEPYSSYKWPFWQANMKIHLILVYWDARNSLFYNLVIPFKDGVTFVVTTATQNLQRCNLESVADMSYALVNICQFLSKFSKFWIQNAHTSDPEAIGGTQRVLNKVQSTVRWRPKPPKIIKVNKVYSLICCTAWVFNFVFQPFDD